jgi:hypothetical protein
MNTIEAELRDLKEIFGTKKILSPADIAPVIGRSVAVLANMRSSGCSPIPSTKSGRLVGFNIRDVAEFIATGAVSARPSKTTTVQISHSPSTMVRQKTTSAGLTKQKNWLLAMRHTLDLNRQLVDAVDLYLQKVTLTKDVNLPIDTVKKTRTGVM